MAATRTVLKPHSKRKDYKMESAILDLALLKMVQEKFEPVESEINVICSMISNSGIFDSINYVDPSTAILLNKNPNDLYVSFGDKCFIFNNITERYNQIISMLKEKRLPETIKITI